ncbi:MAG: hypothetical protein GWO20_00215, partial [Candidatus Korarchaeota archaeon]|nr:hypothetical protein [Candidatus Korarchaeota archaeon]
LFLHEPTINKILGRELSIALEDNASLVDAIREVDKMINRKGGFPVSEYRSLLHMVYNPVENRFYKQVAVIAYDESGQSLNIREDPKKQLPAGITVTLIPAGGCIS